MNVRSKMAILIVLISISFNTKAENLRMFPITLETLHPNSTMHAAFKPQYLFKYNTPANHAECKRLLAGLVLGEKSSMNYFQFPESQRTIIQKEMSTKYKPVGDNTLLTFEEIAEIIDRSTFVLTPSNLKEHYALLRLDNNGNGSFESRNPYKTGDYIDGYRGYAPEDEYSLVDGDIINFQACCGNLAIGIDEPGHVYKPEVKIEYVDRPVPYPVDRPVPYAIHDTTVVTAPNGGNVATNTTNVYGCGTCGSTPAPAPKEKVRVGQTVGGIILGTAVGTTVGVVAGGAILNGIYNRRGRINVPLPNGPSNPPTRWPDETPHQGGSAGTNQPNGTPIPNDPNSTPPIGGHTWLLGQGSNPPQGASSVVQRVGTVSPMRRGLVAN